MITDEKLKQLVVDELKWDPKVDEAHIGVTTSDGSVTLTGHVGSYASAWAALDAVKRVRGVKAIADDMEVNLAFEHRTDDSDIAERIAHVLEWNVGVPDHDIKATVNDGTVTLTGHVDWQHQRQEVEKLVSHVGAVKQVVNRIALKNRVTPRDVRERIEEALLRSANVEAKGVKVFVVGETVTLDGTVKAYYERELAEQAAWAVPGVQKVVDNLVVQ